MSSRGCVSLSMSGVRRLNKAADRDDVVGCYEFSRTHHELLIMRCELQTISQQIEIMINTSVI